MTAALALVVPLLVAVAVVTASPASAASFSNTGSITLNKPATTLADATPYPSAIAVSGLTGTVSSVSLSLNNVSFPFSEDIDALLVAPGGQSLIVVAAVGPNGGTGVAASNSTLTISDSGTLPTDLTPWGPSPNFKPVNFGSYGLGNSANGFNEDYSPVPQPWGDPGQHGTNATLANTFDGTNPNGSWNLYVITTVAGDGPGAIAGGWTLNITTAASAAPTTTSLTAAPNPSFTSGTSSSVLLTATVTKSSDSSAVSEGTVNFTDGGATISGCGAQPVSGGTATCTATFTTEGNHSLEALYSGTTNFGASNATLTQQVNNHTTVSGTSYCNTGSIALGNTVGDAAPYPSRVFVSGLSGTVSQLTVTLKGVSYSQSQDIDALLVGPGGQSLILVANAGPNNGGTISNVTLTLDDGAGSTLAQSAVWGTPGTTVTSRPVNYGGVNETWGSPAPAGPYGNPGPAGSGTATLATQFNGANPDGTWSLYVVDTAGGDGSGAIAGGWCANILTAAAAATNTTISSSNNPSFTAPPANAVTFTATVTKASDNSAVNEGAVNFTSNGVVIPGCGALPVSSAGTATCTTTFATEGSSVIEAFYNGAANLGASNASLTQTVNAHTSVSGNAFCNNSTITLNNPDINDPAIAATPYPSNIFVSGRPADLQHLSVTLKGVTYSQSQDIDALLVGPSGQGLILVAAAGPNDGGAISNVTLTLDDNATSTLAQNSIWDTPNTSVISKPVNYGGFNEVFPPPAPSSYGNPGPAGGGTATLGGTYDGASPNGTWKLYLITTSAGDGTGAVANGWCLNVTTPAPPVLTKAFGASSIPLNGSTTLTFSVANPNASTSLSGVAFADTLPAGLAVASPNGESGTCGGGTITAAAGGSSVSLSGAMLAANASCMFSVMVTATAAGNLINTTDAPTSTEAGTGTAATATLLVVAPPTLTKSFDPPTVALGGTSTLTFTLTNPNTTTGLSGVGFADALPPGVITSSAASNSCFGTSVTVTSGSVSVSNVSLETGGNCTFSVQVTATSPGSKVNTTSLVSSNEGGSGTAATATLTVLAGPPSISKAFGAPSIPLNGSTTLSFTVTNPTGNGTQSGIAFTDTLPAGLVVSTPNGVSGGCGGGTITATAGSGTVSMAGASLADGAHCTFSVNVTGTAAGVQSNSVTVSSTAGGTGNTATASIMVVAPPTLSKSFSPNAIALNATSTLSFTVTNPNTETLLSGIGFSDTMPAGLMVSTPNSVGCGGGTINFTPGGTAISLAEATLAPGATCTFSVGVTGIAAGAQVNTTSSVTSDQGGSGSAASATLTVVAPPTIAKAFGATTIALNGTTGLTFTLTNPAANTMAETGVAFTDTFPSGLLVATPSNVATTCSGASVAAAAGSNQVNATGITIPVGTSCTISLNVVGTTNGAKVNSVTVSSTNGGTGNTATATVTVGSPPVIAKSFGAATMPLGGSTALSFTITNPNPSFTLTGVAFTDSLPAGLVVSTPVVTSGSCGGGTITASAASSTVSLAGATLAGVASCTFSVNVTGTTAGVKNNSVTVSSANAGTGNLASATVTVLAAPTIAKAFAPSSVSFGQDTTLSFTLANPNSTTALTGVQFTDNLPAGLRIANPNGLAGSCGGGTITAAAGSGTITLTGATLPAGGSCTFSLAVTAVAVGTQVNTTSQVGSANGGTGPKATASVAVSRAPTTTTVTVTPATPGFGQNVTFTATVVPSGPNDSGVAPTGTVSFYLNGSGTPIATVALNGSGMASFTTSALAAGANTVIARYSGDTNFLLSSSATGATTTVGCAHTITGTVGVVVLPPGVTCIVGGAVYGGIIGGPGASLDLEGATVVGSVDLVGAANFRMCGSSAGPVTVTLAMGFVVIGDPAGGCAPNTVIGLLTLLGNTHGVQVIGNTVGGVVVALGNSGSGPFPGDTGPTVSGNHP
jgi:uncharacterized repeat protein (TIGR01451 family)